MSTMSGTGSDDGCCSWAPSLVLEDCSTRARPTASWTTSPSAPRDARAAVSTASRLFGPSLKRAAEEMVVARCGTRPRRMATAVAAESSRSRCAMASAAHARLSAGFDGWSAWMRAGGTRRAALHAGPSGAPPSSAPGYSGRRGPSRAAWRAPADRRAA